MVEFALLAPVFFLIIFGILEFGWTFAQFLDVRHAAREGARLAVVNFDDKDGDTTPTDQQDDLVDAICDRLQFATLGPEVSVQTARADGSGNRYINESADDPPAYFDFAVVTVRSDLQQVTGLFAPWLNGIELESEVTLRIEKPATWVSSVSAPPAPYTTTGITNESC